jgi:Resolvase, N terminal domain
MPAKATSSRAKVSPESNGHAPMRAALYARVSSEEQREKQTIQNQIAAAYQYCQQHGLSPVKIYQDDKVRLSPIRRKRSTGNKSRVRGLRKCLNPLAAPQPASPRRVVKGMARTWCRSCVIGQR